MVPCLVGLVLINQEAFSEARARIEAIRFRSYLANSSEGYNNTVLKAESTIREFKKQTPYFGRGERYRVDFEDCTIFIDPVGHRIAGYGTSSIEARHWPAQPLTSSELNAGLNRIYRAAGYSDQLSIVSLGRGGANYSLFEINARPVRQGLRMEDADTIHALVHPATGELHSIDIPRQPSWPEKVVPQVALEQARTTAVSKVLQAGLMSAIEEDPSLELRLAAWFPRRADYVQAQTDKLKSLVDEYQSVLAYVGNYLDLASVGQDGRPTFWQVAVDAKSGELLAIYPPPATVGGRPVVRSIGIELEGDATLWRQDHTARVKAANIRPSQRSTTAQGTPVVIAFGKRFVRVFYDAAANLLWVDQNGKRTYGEPSRNLASELKKIVKREER